MMPRMTSEPVCDGVIITSVSSADRIVDIPERLDGSPVTSLGARLLKSSRGAQGRVLRIPASVVRIDRNALEGAAGLAAVEYGGSAETFFGFGLDAPCDCTLVCGDGFSFEFKRGLPMGFPGFDRAIRSFGSGLTLEIAMRRLSDPVLLSDEDRRGYEAYVSERIMPKAEHAVTTGDVGMLREALSTGLIGDGDLRRLLGRSARSGKVAVTSMLMSETSERFRRKNKLVRPK